MTETSTFGERGIKCRFPVIAEINQARHGTARHGTARHGTARHGTAQKSTAQAQQRQARTAQTAGSLWVFEFSEFQGNSYIYI
jgi:hypothetical protein